MILIIVGASASGKSTLAKAIETRLPNFSRIVTYTTRPKRENEIDGIDYHFISEETFDSMIKQDIFVEHASYRGWKYGTAINFGNNENKIVVLTPAGARAFRRYRDKYPELNIEVLVTYLDVDRRSRLIKMLERDSDVDECIRRSMSDVGQFDSFEDEADYVLNNDEYRIDVNSLCIMLTKNIVEYKSMLSFNHFEKLIEEAENEDEDV